MAPKLDGYDMSFDFGGQFDATAVGIEVMSLARAEMAANSSKQGAVQQEGVGDYDIAAGGPITTEHVWVDCAIVPDGTKAARRACCVDRGNRTPQIEVSVRKCDLNLDSDQVLERIGAQSALRESLWGGFQPPFLLP